MKRLFAIILFATICSPAVLSASLEDLQDHQLRTYRRNWSYSLKELAIGSIVCASSYMTSDEDYQHNLNIFGVGLIIDSVLRIGQNFLEAYVESIGLSQLARRIKTPRGELYKNNQSSIDKIKKEYVDTKINKVRCITSQIGNSINLSLNLAMFYQILSGVRIKDTEFTTEGYLFTLSITGVAVVNYANEIYHSYRTGTSRNDRPFFKISNACSEQILADIYRKQNLAYQVKSVENRVAQIWLALTPTQWNIYRTLQLHGDYQAVVGMLQMLWNFCAYLQKACQKPLVEEALEVHQKPSQDLAAQSQVKRRSELPSIQSTAKGVLHETTAQRKATPNKEKLDPIKNKVKTKGTPASLCDLPQNRTVFHAETKHEPEIKESDQIRHSSLARLEGLSRKNTVSVEEMNVEFHNMLRFLPHASQEGAGHNKEAIRLSFQGSSFRLTYETPHNQRGASSNEYKGLRKERVLDVLRVCYLCGWEEAYIKNYMNENNIVSFYNVPGFLIHILWSRG